MAAETTLAYLPRSGSPRHGNQAFARPDDLGPARGAARVLGVRCDKSSRHARIQSLVSAADEFSRSGRLAQLGERRVRNAEVGSSSLLPSTNFKPLRNARLRSSVLCEQRLVSRRCGRFCVSQFALACEDGRGRCRKHRRNRYGRRRQHSCCSGLIDGNAEVRSPLTSSNTTSVSREPPADQGSHEGSAHSGGEG